MAKYGCVRTDNMSGTTLGKNLVSGIVTPEAQIENGNIVKVGDLMEGEREVRTLSTPAANTPLRDLAVVASEEVVKSRTYNTLDEFVNEKGDIVRCYRLITGDLFSVTAEALDGEGSVGKFVEAQAGTKMKVVDSQGENTCIGKIIAVEGEWFVIEVSPSKEGE